MENTLHALHIVLCRPKEQYAWLQSKDLKNCWCKRAKNVFSRVLSGSVEIHAHLGPVSSELANSHDKMPSDAVSVILLGCGKRET
jgi:hypothetical protein